MPTADHVERSDSVRALFACVDRRFLGPWQIDYPAVAAACRPYEVWVADHPRPYRSDIERLSAPGLAGPVRGQAVLLRHAGAAHGRRYRHPCVRRVAAATGGRRDGRQEPVRLDPRVARTAGSPRVPADTLTSGPPTDYVTRTAQPPAGSSAVVAVCPRRLCAGVGGWRG